jgi:hypothetical protein
MPHPNGMPTVQEVRTMADEELIAHLDQQLGLPPEVRPLTLIQLYASELQRQEQERRSRVMLAYTQAIDRFTKQMRDMTAVILIATFVNLVLAVMVLFR